MPGDFNDIVDLDIKSFEHPWTGQEWTARGHDAKYAMSVVTYFGSIVAVLVIRKASTRMVELCKLMVKYRHRGKGISRSLLKVAEDYTRRGRCDRLFAVVPEHRIYRDHPNSLITWLKKTGFEARTPFLKDHFESCGDSEDGVKFVRKL